MGSPEVSLVILTYNGLGFTKGLLDALGRSNLGYDVEIIVVDNASKDGTGAYIREHYQNVILVELKENMGYAGGMNAGFRAAKGEYVVLLNNDILPKEGWLAELIKIIEKDPAIGIVGPKIYNKYSNKDYVFDGYGTITLMQYMYPLKIDKDINEPFEVFGLGGCCLLFRRCIVDQPFDPEYFIYCEDTYFSWRLKLRGYKNFMVPSSVLYHEGETVIKTQPAIKPYFVFLGERNRLLNFFLFYESGIMLKLIPYLACITIFTNLYDFRKIPARVKAYAWLMLNFRKVLDKRRKIQSERKVADRDILPLLSCYIFDETIVGNGLFMPIAKLINRFFHAYAKLVRLNTIEFNQKILPAAAKSE